MPDLLCTYFLPDAPGRADAELRLFQRIRLPSGVAKTTFPGRFEDLNAFVLQLLPGGRRLALFDAGASSALTSCEWSRQLSTAGVEHELTAGDVLPRGWLSSFGWAAAVLFDPDGRPILCEFRRRSVPIFGGRQRRGIALATLACALRAVARLALLIALADPDTAPRRRRWVHRELVLTSPSAPAQGGLTPVEDDITEPGRYGGAFDAVRAANLTTPTYFDRATLERMLGNLAARVCDGGLLIICRTRRDGINDATVFRRTGSQLAVVRRLGDGSEVEAIALAVSIAD